MITSTKLKIWTLVAHGLIFIAGGHGIAFIFAIETMGFASLFESGTTSQLILDAWLFTLVTLLGQICVAVSIVKKQPSQKRIFHNAGLVLLWISVALLAYASIKDNYIFGWITVIPFFICTIITFFGKRISRFRENFIDHIP